MSAVFTLKDVLADAERLVVSERREEYGDASINLANIAQMWSVIFGKEITAQQVSLAMICMKVCRELASHKRDNLVDIAGYAALTELVASKS